MSTRVAAPKVIAHRGASASAPENSIASIRLAWEMGADAVEVDLWASADDVVIVFHDASLRRFIGVAVPVTELSWEALRQIDIGSWKGPAWSGEKIPRLEEVLMTLPEGRELVLEIKDSLRVVPLLEVLLTGFASVLPQLTVIAFDLDTAKEFKKRLPQITVLWLRAWRDMYNPEGQICLQKLNSVITAIREAGLDGLDLGGNHPCTADYARALAALRAELDCLYVWTVNDPSVARFYAVTGVDGITTDCPDQIRSWLGSSMNAAPPAVSAGTSRL